MRALIVDSRETNSTIPSLLQAAGFNFEQQEMDVGDYRIGADIVIERKSARTDLAVSIMEGRLFGQAEALCAVAARPIFLVEGNLSDVRSQIGEDALWGAISALAVFWNMQVLFSQDVRSSAKLIGTMARHVSEGLGYEVPLRSGKPRPSHDGGLSQYLVEGLPGVGPETARKLIGHFGSARGVFTASATDLRGCKGIGPKTADGIAAALDLQPTSFRVTKQPPQAFGSE